MSTAKMTTYKFERLLNLALKAAQEKPYDGIDLTETRKLTLGRRIDIPNKPDMSKMTGGRGKPSFGIPSGEWSLIKAIQEGKVNGRIQTER